MGGSEWLVEGVGILASGPKVQEVLDVVSGPSPRDCGLRVGLCPGTHAFSSSDGRVSSSDGRVWPGKAGEVGTWRRPSWKMVSGKVS